MKRFGLISTSGYIIYNTNNNYEPGGYRNTPKYVGGRGGACGGWGGGGGRGAEKSERKEVKTEEQNKSAEARGKIDPSIVSSN